MQEKTYNFFQILGFYKRKGRFALLSGLTQKVAKRSRLRLLRYSLPAFRCSRRKLAFGSNRRRSRSLHSGRSLNAHQPKANPCLPPSFHTTIPAKPPRKGSLLFPLRLERVRERLLKQPEAKYHTHLLFYRHKSLIIKNMQAEIQISTF